MEDKTALRKRIREKMEAQSPSERRMRSAAIEKKLFDLDRFRKAPVVCFYAAMEHEVDTGPMIDKALSMGMCVSVPRCDTKTVELTLYEIRSREHLVEGTWGIPEPQPHHALVVKPEDVGCVVVPGVAFDADGNRIGNGKGFYDRFLKKISPNALKVGLAFDFQVVPRVPVEKHDVKLDLILTD